MTERNTARQQERTGGHDTANNIESSLLSHSSDAFMHEVNDARFSSSTNGSAARFTAAAAVDRLNHDGYLNRAVGAEAQKVYDQAHGYASGWLGHDGGKLSIQDIDQYARSGSHGELERQLLSRLRSKVAHDGEMSGSDIQGFNTTEQQHADLKNLYAKDRHGHSLFDSVTDGRGGISGSKLDARLDDTHLSAQDKSSLNYVNSLRSSSYAGLGSKYGDLTRGQLADAADSNGVKQREVEARRGTRTDGPISPETVDARENLNNLFAKDRSGHSLYDRIKERDGSITADRVDKELSSNPALSEKDRSTLRYLQDKTTSVDTSPGAIEGGYAAVSRNDLSKSDLAGLSKDAGINFDHAVHQRAGSRVEDSATEQDKRDFAHLFAKGANGLSLYERLPKDASGNIAHGAIEEALRQNNTEADRRSLQYLNKVASQDSSFYGVPFSGADMSKSRLQELAHEHGVSESQLHRNHLDVQPQPGPQHNEAREHSYQPKPGREAQAHTETHQEAGPVLSDAVKQALTIHRGESYPHAAERLLGLAGVHDPTGKQISRLSHELWAVDHRKRGALKVGETLKVDDQVMRNSDVASLFGSH